MKAILLLTLTTFFIPNLSSAVIRGKETNVGDVSTLKLRTSVAFRDRRTGKILLYDSICSSVVVGTSPLTLLTAAHCVDEAYINPETSLPDTRIDLPEELAANNLHLRKAIWLGQRKKNISRDLAILIFEGGEHLPLSPIPIAPSKALNSERSSVVKICGFGRAYDEENSASPYCADRDRVKTDDLFNFDAFFPEKYKESEHLIYIMSTGRYNKKNKGSGAVRLGVQVTKENIIAINRLNKQGDYSIDIPISKVGDSGGPWFIQGERQPLQVAAIQSIVEKFDSRGQWNWDWMKSTPKDQSTRSFLDDRPYASYGVRLDTPEALELFVHARNEGADL